MSTELSRTPKLRTVNGVRIFCSPRCGAACLRSRYDIAVKKAAALKKALGRGWTTTVHENLGWHWYATHKESGASMHEHSPTSYWVQVSVKGAGQHHLTETTPQKARDALVAQLQASSEALLQAAYAMDVDKRTTGKGK